MREWWHKIRGHESFRIKYPDNKVSQKMSWKQARAYAAIFSGTVFFDPDPPEPGFPIL